MSDSQSNSYAGTASAVIHVPAEKVWDALTNPDMIRQYLFGTQVDTGWQVGGPITWRGVWEGKPYEDKGTILDLIPNRLLRTTYFSSLSGLEDRPENYLTVTYTLAETDGETIVTITTEDNNSQESADQASANWAMVLQSLKELLEQKGR